MKQISIKSALMRIMAVLFVAMGSVSASAQYYMNVVLRNGEKTMYPVMDIDSVFISGKEPAHQYVDLGLSVKWATCNMGADSPEEYGISIVGVKLGQRMNTLGLHMALVTVIIGKDNFQNTI